MSSKSNDQGRAYEYICLHSLQDAISAIRKSQIIHNSSYEAAEHAWNTLSIAEKALYTLSAKSTIDTIFALEPNIVEVGDDTLNLYIQSDEHGEDADVRDIIIDRKDIVWEIGLSIKHNHMAVKHSRLAKSLDFGQKRGVGTVDIPDIEAFDCPTSDINNSPRPSILEDIPMPGMNIYNKEGT